jgi:hypothetical protein
MNSVNFFAGACRRGRSLPGLKSSHHLSTRGAQRFALKEAAGTASPAHSMICTVILLTLD